MEKGKDDLFNKMYDYFLEKLAKSPEYYSFFKDNSIGDFNKMLNNFYGGISFIDKNYLDTLKNYDKELFNKVKDKIDNNDKKKGDNMFEERNMYYNFKIPKDAKVFCVGNKITTKYGNNEVSFEIGDIDNFIKMLSECNTKNKKEEEKNRLEKERVNNTINAIKKEAEKEENRFAKYVIINKIEFDKIKNVLGDIKNIGKLEIIVSYKEKGYYIV